MFSSPKSTSRRSSDIKAGGFGRRGVLQPGFAVSHPAGRLWRGQRSCDERRRERQAVRSAQLSSRETKLRQHSKHTDESAG